MLKGTEESEKLVTILEVKYNNGEKEIFNVYTSQIENFTKEIDTAIEDAESFIKFNTIEGEAVYLLFLNISRLRIKTVGEGIVKEEKARYEKEKVSNDLEYDLEYNKKVLEETQGSMLDNKKDLEKLKKEKEKDRRIKRKN